MCMEGENTPNVAYLTHFQQATNSLHPSCNPASPMEVEQADNLESEEITLVRRGAHDRDRAKRESWRDRERRGQHREERRDRHHRRDRGQERGEGIRQRDRDYRQRHGNPHPRGS